MLTAADVATQNSLLGTSLLGFQSGDVKETATLVLPAGWYWCDGSNKSRGTDAALFNAITIQQNGVLVNGSAVVTGLSDTSLMATGMYISGNGIQAATFIQSVDSSTQVTMNLTATSSATSPLVFAPFGVGDGVTTFGLPNRADLAVGRDNASGSASNLKQVSTNISLTSGSATATVGSAAGLAPGMFISHPKVPVGTTISTISGTTITMSGNATATVSSAGRFSPLPDAQRLNARGGSISQSTTLVTANLPAYTPVGSITNGQVLIGGSSSETIGTQNSVSYAPNAGSSVGATNNSLAITQQTSTFAGNAQGGTSTPILTTLFQPTIVMNRHFSNQ